MEWRKLHPVKGGIISAAGLKKPIKGVFITAAGLDKPTEGGWISAGGLEKPKKTRKQKAVGGFLSSLHITAPADFKDSNKITKPMLKKMIDLCEPKLGRNLALKTVKQLKSVLDAVKKEK